MGFKPFFLIYKGKVKLFVLSRIFPKDQGTWLKQLFFSSTSEFQRFASPVILPNRTVFVLYFNEVLYFEIILDLHAVVGDNAKRSHYLLSSFPKWRHLPKLSVQFSSVRSFSHVRLCDPMNRSMLGLPVHHQLPEFTQTHVLWVSDAIQWSHPLSSPSPPAPNPSQHQGLFQWVTSSHQVAKGLEFQLQHQSFQWTPRTDLL